MCTYSITLNDNLINQVRSEFPNDEALQQWLEDQIEDILIRFKAKKRSAPPCSYTDEEMHNILVERIRQVEAGEEKLIPNEVVVDSIRAKYGF